MKKVLLTLISLVLIASTSFATKNASKAAKSKKVSSDIIIFDEIAIKPSSQALTPTTRIAKRMHSSWDVDKDGVNDCEKDGSCDHTVDYSLPRVNNVVREMEKNNHPK